MELKPKFARPQKPKVLLKASNRILDTSHPYTFNQHKSDTWQHYYAFRIHFSTIL